MLLNEANKCTSETLTSETCQGSTSWSYGEDPSIQRLTVQPVKLKVTLSFKQFQLLAEHEAE